MDWLSRMNNALDYIEEHLTGTVDLAEAAGKAYCSSTHFQRMFTFITNISLSEYVRRRRMTLAAFELQNSPIKVIELALKYGYESPEAFTRAFHQLHGVTPSAARDKGMQLKAYPRMSFHITIKGDAEMNYRIEERGGFAVFGVEQVIDCRNGNNFVQIPEFWRASMEDGSFNRVMNAAPPCSIPGLGEVGAIMCYRHTGEDTFPYMICAFDFQSEADPQGLQRLEVKPHTWAIFKSEEGTQAETGEKIQAVWKRIFPEWFPNSGYEHADGPELELYFHTGDNRGYSEVWIPVVKKA
ncbi:AraC family transcriptional regulator [Paenibacillus montanisoli]|uniref:AraC family transcriptional regulator n=1 Tax=Paenibacillus montanisoli TaxID=2081970 RepID=A0A328TV92_9BACL|nr:AraC family transcriptional regulator [Paenibacillus montanisoli]RAP73403.1 AraC family transcriptional regulator [Paenibacillus montanisoli]